MSPVYWRLEVDSARNAEQLAAAWMQVPAEERSPARLHRVATELGIDYVPGYAEGELLEGAEQLAPWLTLLRAPGRAFLEVDLEAVLAPASENALTSN